MTHCGITYYLDESCLLCAHDDEEWAFLDRNGRWSGCGDELRSRLTVPRVYSLLFLEMWYDFKDRKPVSCPEEYWIIELFYGP